MLDAIDREIIGELERDGRISWQELGRRVRLSPNATGDRVRRLERRGIITGYRAVVDPAALGRSLEALISVRLAPNSDAGQLEERLAAWPEVEEAVHVTGRFDFELKVSTSGPRGTRRPPRRHEARARCGRDGDPTRPPADRARPRP